VEDVIGGRFASVTRKRRTAPGSRRPSAAVATPARPDRPSNDVLATIVQDAPLGVAIVGVDRVTSYHNAEFARLTGHDPRSGSIRLPGIRRQDGSPFEPGGDPVDAALGPRPSTWSEIVQLADPDGPSRLVRLTASPTADDGSGIEEATLFLEDLSPDAGATTLSAIFVGALSHEFRTPITSILAGIHLIGKQVIPTTVPASLVSDVTAEAERLYNVVEDLLAVARVQHGLIQRASEPALVHHLAARVAHDEALRWPKRSVIIEIVDGVPAVDADDADVVQILRNLIASALESCSDGGSATLIVREADGEVEVLLRFRGAGLPPSIGRDAFRFFDRSTGPGSRSHGTGLGLFVAATLVEAYGGRIWIRTRPRAKTEIGVRLPIAAERG
jgi:signal transduction histidine kinase